MIPQWRGSLNDCPFSIAQLCYTLFRAPQWRGSLNDCPLDILLCSYASYD